MSFTSLYILIYLRSVILTVKMSPGHFSWLPVTAWIVAAVLRGKVRQIFSYYMLS
jgi:hypothetical protein